MLSNGTPPGGWTDDDLVPSAAMLAEGLYDAGMEALTQEAMATGGNAPPVGYAEESKPLEQFQAFRTKAASLLTEMLYGLANLEDVDSPSNNMAIEMEMFYDRLVRAWGSINEGGF